MARNLLLVPSVSVLAQQAVTRGVQDHTILFVCEHGSAKSIVATAHFNDLAARTGSPYRAIARGLHLHSEIPPYVKSGLRAERLDIRGWQPKQFIERDALTAAPRDYARMCVACLTSICGGQASRLGYRISQRELPKCKPFHRGMDCIASQGASR